MESSQFQLPVQTQLPVQQQIPVQQAPAQVQIQMPIQPQVQTQASPQEEKIPCNKISYTQYRSENLIGTSFAEKQFQDENTGGTMTYLESQDKYNYGTIVDEFLVEGPTMTCHTGLDEKKNKKGYSTFQVAVKLGLKEANFIAFLDLLRKDHANLMIPHKVKLGLHEFPDDMIVNMLKQIYTLSKDKVTKAVIPGGTKTLYLKLKNRGYGLMADRTIFSGPDGKPIPWDLLKGVVFDLTPLDSL